MCFVFRLSCSILGAFGGIVVREWGKVIHVEQTPFKLSLINTEDILNLAVADC